MQARSRRVKGALFEREVAALVLKLLGPPFTKKDCYRTPMSGGHRFASKSDLTVSELLTSVFPFAIECKHQKTFTPEILFSGTKLIEGWCEQAVRATKKNYLFPMVIMKGNRTAVFVALSTGIPKGTRVGELPMGEFELSRREPYLTIRCCQRYWRIYRWDKFCKVAEQAIAQSRRYSETYRRLVKNAK